MIWLLVNSCHLMGFEHLDFAQCDNSNAKRLNFKIVSLSGVEDYILPN